jgi:hypothetical protein
MITHLPVPTDEAQLSLPFEGELVAERLRLTRFMFGNHRFVEPGRAAAFLR